MTSVLEELFSNLTVDAAATTVAAVKKDGVEKSGLASNIGILAARCESSDDADALAALATVQALMNDAPEAQAFTIQCLTACMLNLIE
jgi:hypothetical protein